MFLGEDPFYFTGFNSAYFIDWSSWGRDWGRQKVAETMFAAQVSTSLVN
jgi:hypothetical protein